MRILAGIVIALIFGFLGAAVGAFLAGPLGDWVVLQKAFGSPDEQIHYDYIARIGITAGVALVGIVVGVVIATRYKSRSIRREN